MSRRLWFHIFWVTALCLLILLGARLHRASGQPIPRDENPITRGQSLTQAWCMACHTVGPLTGSAQPNLDFEAIARMSSTTELSLRVFLGSSHRGMPNIIVKGRDLDDIIAYILSLRRS
jgi:mono/diheme cytochrome c family protein